MKWI